MRALAKGISQTVGGLPTVLVPGLLCTPQLYAAQLSLFWAAGPVFLADTTRHRTLGDLARNLLHQAPPEFRLVGFSMGGYIAFEVLRLAPSRVKELILIDTSARSDTQQIRERRQQMIHLAQNGRFGRIPLMFSRLVAPGRSHDTQLASVVEAMRMSIGAEAFVRQQQAMLNRPDARPGLRNIACRTLIMVGEEDRVTPVSAAHEMYGDISQARLVTIQNAGHLAPMEQPEAVNTALQHWLMAG
ncbi:MAG: alpha/beta hydrolase [Lautropia sp.]|nr:alpha/beta hydrolase [Lautropia sp.]